ncbi:GyrI-like domain-containing protein [Mucilaginibacter pedocola]|uniref:AraC effector-binding domain-containing protein n=1 Tax=Mucilaginibacter pedocola TaxID=1792845 RepID=A0A1S9PE04_9SPHI|nr:GyrI-like domain-containing protein [Mucilaginibacter pedocola]OOQ59149.1 hypothetical protein BC343_29450 [Mucilaginibacter pedocola]
MLSTPVITNYPERPYVAIEKSVKQPDIGNELPPLHGKLYQWLAAKGLSSTEPPFFRYLAYNNGELLVRVGLSTTEKLESDGEVIADAFPAGNYAELIHAGNYNGLMHAHMALESWVKDNGYREQLSPSTNGCTWGGRTEFYLNDCTELPNPADWQTKVSFLLAEH